MLGSLVVAREQRPPLEPSPPIGITWLTPSTTRLHAMETDRTPIEARQARKPGIVRYMLLISLAAIVAIMVIVYFYFSSTSGQ